MLEDRSDPPTDPIYPPYPSIKPQGHKRIKKIVKTDKTKRIKTDKTKRSLDSVLREGSVLSPSTWDCKLVKSMTVFSYEVLMFVKALSKTVCSKSK